MSADRNRANVLALLPNAGLANKLFVWAKAEAFAFENDLSVGVIGWSYPRVGAWLRGEFRGRRYGSYFRTAGANEIIALINVAIGRGVREPAVAKLAPNEKKRFYYFCTVPHWSDYFGDLRRHRSFLIARLASLVKPELLDHLSRLSEPTVGVHVRLGDFRQLRAGEDFRNVGGVRTPHAYFINIICNMRRAAGYDIPITIFSDGSDDELREIMELPKIARARTSNDLLDLLLLARSRVIITSAGSTFGEWAGFLSDAVLIRHPDHVHTPIRPREMNPQIYDGPAPSSLDEWCDLWKTQLLPAIMRTNDANSRSKS